MHAFLKSGKLSASGTVKDKSQGDKDGDAGSSGIKKLKRPQPWVEK